MTDDFTTVTEPEHAILSCLVHGTTTRLRIKEEMTLDRREIVECIRRVEERGLNLVLSRNRSWSAALTDAGLDYLNWARTNIILAEYRHEP